MKKIKEGDLFKCIHTDAIGLFKVLKIHEKRATAKVRHLEGWRGFKKGHIFETFGIQSNCKYIGQQVSKYEI